MVYFAHFALGLTMHVPQLILDLTLILAAAGLTTLLFRRLKQPMVLGYLLAGLLIGPNIGLLPTISDVKSISIWGEIGVIFLLFGLGLEFSFKRLLKLGGSAAITGVLEVSAMLFTGYLLGWLLGWSNMDSLFLGAILSISSTTIILRAFEELGLKKRKFTGMVMGVLVIEDLVAVVLLVVLSTLSLSGQTLGFTLVWSLYKLAIFLAILFIGGIFILPTFLRNTSKWMNDEGLMLASLAFCFVMVVMVSNAGFSPALGAFIMGSILAETPFSEKIEHLVQPLKNLFGAVFFVSVGMLINLNDIANYGLPIALVTLVLIAGKITHVTIGALVSGQPLKQAVQVGTSMAQIGEFSFIIAALGQTMGVTSGFLYPVTVGVAVFTTFLTPYTIRSADSIHDWLDGLLPKRWLPILQGYAGGAQKTIVVNHWKDAIKAYSILVGINTMILLGITLVSSVYLVPWMQGLWPALRGLTGLNVLVTFLLMTPFLWALMIKRVDNISYNRLWLDKKYNKGPLVAMALLRITIGVLLVGFLLSQHYNGLVTVVGALCTIPIVLLVFSTRLQRFYNKLERLFLHNFHEKEKANAVRSAHQFIPWDAHLAHFEILAEASYVGKTLEELRFRERLGINIALIERGKLVLHAPSRLERLMPNDKLAVIGTDAQLEEFAKDMHESILKPADQIPASDVVLLPIPVEMTFPYLNQTIRESLIREHTLGLIVGIERKGERILNPDSTMRFLQGDMVWLVGSKKKINAMLGKR